MRILVASAKVAEINSIPWAPLAGIVTNPTVLLEAGADWKATVETLDREPFESFPRIRSIHVQCIATDKSAILDEVASIRGLVQRRSLVIKLPAARGSLGAIRHIQTEYGLKTNVTAISSLAQAQLAAEAGCNFVSVYIGRLNAWGEEQGRHELGFQVLDEIANYLEKKHPSVELIAASVRDREQYERAVNAGSDAVAAPPDLLVRSMQHPLTDAGIAGFADEWRRVAV